MTDIGADFFSFAAGNAPVGAVSTHAAPLAANTATAHPAAPPSLAAPAINAVDDMPADGLWYNDGREAYEGIDGVITHVAAKASGSCPYMRELLGLPPLPTSTAHPAPVTPPLKASGLNDDLVGSGSASSLPSTPKGSMLLATTPSHHHNTGHGGSSAQKALFHQAHHHHPAGTVPPPINAATCLGGLSMAAAVMAAPHPINQQYMGPNANISGCPFLSGKKAQKEAAAGAPAAFATNSSALPPMDALPAATTTATAVATSIPTAAAEGRCPVTGKSGLVPKGHPGMPATASAIVPPPSCPFAKKFAAAAASNAASQAMLQGTNGAAPHAVSTMAVVAISAPDNAVGTSSSNASLKCPFINVFANHIDSYIHRALMTSVLNRITLKSFLREKKVLQKVSINSSAIASRKRDRLEAEKKNGTNNAAAATEDGEEVAEAAHTPTLPEEVDESTFAVIGMSEDDVEEKCAGVLQTYMANGTARPRMAAKADADGNTANAEGGAEDAPAPKPLATTATPKVSPAVAAILAAAAANAAHISAKGIVRPPIGGSLQNPKPAPSAAAAAATEDSTATPAINPSTPTAPFVPHSGAAGSPMMPNIPGLNKSTTGTPNASRPQSGASTPSMRPRRIGDIDDELDATAGATPSAVASMLSSMRLGREVSLPMAMSFLHQATNRAEERFTDMYLRVISEACGIKTGPTPPIKPPAKLLGPDGQPNPSAMMVMVPSASLLTRVIADGRLPALAGAVVSAPPAVDGPSGAPTTAAESTAPAVLQPIRANTLTPPKTFLHDVLVALYVPRVQHFFSLWLHAVEKYEELVGTNGGCGAKSTTVGSEIIPAGGAAPADDNAAPAKVEAEDESKDESAVAIADALHRIDVSAADLVHCLHVYSKMLHYHIMYPSSMKQVIDALIERADLFVASRAKGGILAGNGAGGNGDVNGSVISDTSSTNTAERRVYPAAHRFFALATIFAVRESVPFRTLMAMETGEGAAMREAIVAELIMADKQLAGFGGSTEASSVPAYAHLSSARTVIKTALYVSALATISPATVMQPPAPAVTAAPTKGTANASATAAPTAPTPADAKAAPTAPTPHSADATAAAKCPFLSAKVSVANHSAVALPLSADGSKKPPAAPIACPVSGVTATMLAATAAPFLPASLSVKPASGKAATTASGGGAKKGGSKGATNANNNGMPSAASVMMNAQQAMALHQQQQVYAAQQHYLAIQHHQQQYMIAAALHQQQQQQQQQQQVAQMMIAPFTNVPMTAQQPLVVPFGPFLQIQQQMQEQQLQQAMMGIGMATPLHGSAAPGSPASVPSPMLPQPSHFAAAVAEAEPSPTSPASPTTADAPPAPGSFAAIAKAQYDAMQQSAEAYKARKAAAEAANGSGVTSPTTNAPTPAGPANPMMQQAVPQQRSRVPPFYTSTSSTPSSPAASGSSGSEPNRHSEEGPHHGSSANKVGESADDAAAKCPFLRAQFPSGVPAIIPSSTSNGPSGNHHRPASPVPVGASNAVADASSTTAATYGFPQPPAEVTAPYYAAHQQQYTQQAAYIDPTPTAGLVGHTAGPYSLYYPVVPQQRHSNTQAQQYAMAMMASSASGVTSPTAMAPFSPHGGHPYHHLAGMMPLGGPQELIAPVYQPRGTGTALKPPPYQPNQ